MKDVQSPRGTQDILPPLSERFRAHELRSAAIFERAGYRYVITPMFEDTAVFARGVGEASDIVSKEMYTFDDRSGNSLTLRPEGTTGVMRAVISNRLWDHGKPVKLWYAAAMFRYDRPQKGRYRQHHQLGIEAIGTEAPEVDAEVIGIGREMLDVAGLEDAVLLLNTIGHPGPDCRDAHRARLVEFLEGHRDELDEDCKRRMRTNPLRVFDCKVPRDQEILSEAPLVTDFLCDACRTHFESVRGYLDDADVKYELAPRLVRGLDYYTRTAFEFQTPALESQQNTICGGGRYDGLSELLGGPPLPGIGFGSGIERVLLAAELAGKATDDWALASLVIPLEDDDRARALHIVRALRAAGIVSDVATGSRSVKDHIARASKAGVRTVVLLGPEERASDSVAVRDMQTREQALVPRAQVVERVKELLGR